MKKIITVTKYENIVEYQRDVPLTLLYEFMTEYMSKNLVKTEKIGWGYLSLEILREKPETSEKMEIFIGEINLSGRSNLRIGWEIIKFELWGPALGWFREALWYNHSYASNRFLREIGKWLHEHPENNEVLWDHIDPQDFRFPFPTLEIGSLF